MCKMTRAIVYYYIIINWCAAGWTRYMFELRETLLNNFWPAVPQTVEPSFILGFCYAEAFRQLASSVKGVMTLFFNARINVFTSKAVAVVVVVVEVPAAAAPAAFLAYFRCCFIFSKWFPVFIECVVHWSRTRVWRHNGAV